MQQTITNLGVGLELRKPEGCYADQGCKVVARDPQAVAHFVGLLEEWCSKIRHYLDDR